MNRFLSLLFILTVFNYTSANSTDPYDKVEEDHLLSRDINKVDIQPPSYFFNPLSLEDARRLVKMITHSLYFRSAEDKELFKDEIELKLKSVFGSKTHIIKGDSLNLYHSSRTQNLLVASYSYKIYESLRMCQLEKEQVVDSLSEFIVDMMSEASETFEYSDTREIFASSIYSIYKNYLLVESEEIYERRLEECLNFTPQNYVDRNEFRDEIDSGKEELYVSENIPGAIQG